MKSGCQKIWKLAGPGLYKFNRVGIGYPEMLAHRLGQPTLWNLVYLSGDRTKSAECAHNNTVDLFWLLKLVPGDKHLFPIAVVSVEITFVLSLWRGASEIDR